MESKEESDLFLEILENLEYLRDSRDFSSEKTPFVMTPLSGPDRPLHKTLPANYLCGNFGSFVCNLKEKNHLK